MKATGLDYDHKSGTVTTVEITCGPTGVASSRWSVMPIDQFDSYDIKEGVVGVDRWSYSPRDLRRGVTEKGVRIFGKTGTEAMEAYDSVRPDHMANAPVKAATMAYLAAFGEWWK